MAGLTQRERARIVVVVVALAGATVPLGAPPIAHGQSDEDRATAIAHYEQAEAYFKAGTFDKAALEYRKSYAIVAAPLLLFNIGLAEENAGSRDAAIASYQEYLDSESKGVKAPEARARLLALRRAAKAEKEREPKRRSEPADRRDPAEVEKRAPSTFVDDDMQVPSSRTEDPRFILAPIGASAVALAAISIGVGFGISSNSLKGDLESDRDAGIPLSSSDPRFDDGRQRAIVADVFYGIGAVSALAAGYLWFRYSRSASSTGQPPATTATVVTNGRSVGVRVSF